MSDHIRGSVIFISWWTWYLMSELVVSLRDGMRRLPLSSCVRHVTPIAVSMYHSSIVYNTLNGDWNDLIVTRNLSPNKMHSSPPNSLTTRLMSPITDNMRTLLDRRTFPILMSIYHTGSIILHFSIFSLATLIYLYNHHWYMPVHIEDTYISAYTS